MAAHIRVRRHTRGRERAERRALIELDVVADDRRLADDDARAVVDEEVLADGCAGMNINARAAVRVLGHDARNQRHFEQKQLVRQAVDRDGEQPRIGNDDFVQTCRCWVAVVERLQVGCQQCAHVGNLLQKADGHLLRLPVNVDGGLLRHTAAAAQGNRNLLLQQVRRVLNEGGQGVRRAVHMVGGVAEIARKDDALQLANQGDNHVAVWLVERFNAVNGAAGGIIRENILRQAVDTAFQRVRQHQNPSFTLSDIQVLHLSILHRKRSPCQFPCENRPFVL